MFYSRTSNNLVNKTHQCSLRLILDDRESNFGELLRKNNDIAIDQGNIQMLLTEVFKTAKVMEGIFNVKPNNYNLRNFQELVIEKKRTVKNGFEIISYRAPQLWSICLKRFSC